MRFIIVIQVEDCDDNNTDYDEDRLWSETFIFISYFIFFNKQNQIKKHNIHIDTHNRDDD